jgi:hypothetical protein
MAGKSKIIRGALEGLSDAASNLPNRREFLQGLGALAGIAAVPAAHVVPKVFSDLAPIATKTAAKTSLADLAAWKPLKEKIKDAFIEMQATNDVNFVTRDAGSPSLSGTEFVEIDQNQLKNAREGISKYVDEFPEGAATNSVTREVQEKLAEAENKIMADIWFHYASNGKFNVSGKGNSIGKQIFEWRNMNQEPRLTDMGDGSGFVEYENPWDFVRYRSSMDDGNIARSPENTNVIRHWDAGTKDITVGKPEENFFEQFEEMRISEGMTNKQMADFIADSGYGPKDNAFASPEVYADYFTSAPHRNFKEIVESITKDVDPVTRIPAEYKIDFPE